MTPQPDKHELSRRIKDAALALGFDKVGILEARPLEDEGERLYQWLDRGYQAEMGWMARHAEKRIDPASLMAGTRSIVCVALNYATPPEPNRAADGVKIAQYAQGTDYHYVLKRRLKTLLKTLQTWVPEARGRALTDSAPILEKPLAVRAGLGWLGKNGLLITPELGSLVFLGELLLDIDLVPDQARIPNRCGTCTRCIDACPTQAIVEPTVVDSNRCIAYWTIEYKGETFPDDITGKLDGWVFGCDICQDVCPWNRRFSKPTPVEEFQPRPWNRTPTAGDILALTEAEFAERYRKSAIKRVKRRGFQRNAALLQTSGKLKSKRLSEAL